MTSWDMIRSQWTRAESAVHAAGGVEGLERLRDHPVVQAALAQIDMAERAIASVANEMLVAFYDEEED